MSDGLGDIQAALDASGVYVHPSMTATLPAAARAEVRANLAASPTPVYVVLHPMSPGDEYGGQMGDLLSRLHDRSGVDGVYLGFDDGSLTKFALTSRMWGDDPGFDPYLLDGIATGSAPDSVSQQAVTVTGSIAAGTVREDAQAVARQTSTTVSSSPADSGATPWVVGGGVVLALVLACLAWRRRPRRRPFELPASVLDLVRDAHDEELWRRAGDDVQALGEAIDATDIEPGDAPSSWQQALDHYQEARALLGDGDRSAVDILDVVGAIVLAGRGRSSLDAARSGTDFQAERPCFLNPLHGRASVDTHISGRRDAVPLCAACRSALRSKRRPDILDVERRGRAVHYFDTGAEPWASTGYGALRPDLIRALHSRR